MPGCDFDAAITGIGDQFLIETGKQKEAEAKENSHGRYCDNAERDEVEQRPGALIRGIGKRTRRFGRLWPRVSGCTSRHELPRQLVEQLLSEHSAVHLAIALSAARLRGRRGSDRGFALVAALPSYAALAAGSALDKGSGLAKLTLRSVASAAGLAVSC
jgi:hypothetical protein